MNDTELKQILFIEMHRRIEETAELALGFFDSSQSSEIDVSYPTNDSLTQQEKELLAHIVLSPITKTAIKKVFADVASDSLFHLFSLMDGVADPEMEPSDTWLGAKFIPLDAESIQDEDHQEMLHDEFYSSYWTYKASKDNKSSN